MPADGEGVRRVFTDRRCRSRHAKQRRIQAHTLCFMNKFICLALLLFGACKTTVPNREPLGEVFPSVAGESLDGQPVSLDTFFAAGPATVFLVGFEQRTQFDIDRWLLGLIQAETPVTLLEIPTIPGLVPGLASGMINAGMRGGIPPEDWAIVVTLYGDDASRITDFTGNELGNNARVLLLDRAGRVVWFHDRGYSATGVLALDARARELVREAAASEN